MHTNDTTQTMHTYILCSIPDYLVDHRFSNAIIYLKWVCWIIFGRENLSLIYKSVARDGKLYT